MGEFQSRALAVVCVAGAVVAAPQARAFGIGLEAGAAGVNSWGPTGGILAENVFALGLGFLDPWVDVQAPLSINTGGAQPARFLMVDLGLRAGLGFDIVQPYLGILGQTDVLFNRDEGQQGRYDVLWGFGGDFGVDFAFSIVRLGAELRILGLTTEIQTGDTAGPGIEFQALASARLEF